MNKELEERISTMLGNLSQIKETASDKQRDILDNLHSTLASQRNILLSQEGKIKSCALSVETALRRWVSSHGVTSWLHRRRLRRICKKRIVYAGELYLMQETIEDLLHLCEYTLTLPFPKS